MSELVKVSIMVAISGLLLLSVNLWMAKVNAETMSECQKRFSYDTCYLTLNN